MDMAAVMDTMEAMADTEVDTVIRITVKYFKKSTSQSESKILFIRF